MLKYPNLSTSAVDRSGLHMLEYPVSGIKTVSVGLPVRAAKRQGSSNVKSLPARSLSHSNHLTEKAVRKRFALIRLEYFFKSIFLVPFLRTFNATRKTLTWKKLLLFWYPFAVVFSIGAFLYVLLFTHLVVGTEGVGRGGSNQGTPLTDKLPVVDAVVSDSRPWFVGGEDESAILLAKENEQDSMEKARMVDVYRNLEEHPLIAERGKGAERSEHEKQSAIKRPMRSGNVDRVAIKKERSRKPVQKADKSLVRTILADIMRADDSVRVEQLQYRTPIRQNNLTSASKSDSLQLSKEITHLIEGLQQKYEQGDVEGFFQYFSQTYGAQDGESLSALKSDYRKLFAITDERRIALHDMDWHYSDSAVTGKGRFNIDMREKGSWQVITFSGVIAVEIVREQNQIAISSLAYHYD